MTSSSTQQKGGLLPDTPRGRLLRAILIIVIVTLVAGFSVTIVNAGVDAGPAQSSTASPNHVNNLGGEIVGDHHPLESSENTPVERSAAIGNSTDESAKISLVDFDVERQEGDLTQAQREAAEAGVEDGIRLAEEQGVTVTDEQGATTGAVHGALLQHQDVNVTQLQAIVTGSAGGALIQHQVANVTQLQSAAWGASQEIEYTVEGPDPTASVMFEEQESDGTSVEVASVSLDEGGFVAIHEDGDVAAEASTVDNVIGVSEYLEPGDHEDVEVTLFEDVPGADFDRETLGDGDHDLTAIAHRDTDDTQTFAYVDTMGEEDEPYVDDEGDPIADDAIAVVEDDPTEIDSCTVIDEPGEYELTRDLEDRSGLSLEDGRIPVFVYDRVCIAIRTSDVVLEGNGHLVDGVGAGSSVGINVYNREEDLENVTVRNLRVEDWSDGLEAGRAYVSDAEVRLENVAAIDNAVAGIRLGRAHESTLENVTARANGGAGINLYQTGDTAIHRSTATENGASGISIGQSARIHLQDVVADENDGNGVDAGAGSGHHSFENVSADRNGGNGFFFSHSSGIEINQSTAVGNGEGGIVIDGLRVDGHEYTDVTISGNGDWEVDAREGEATGTALRLGDELTIDFIDEAAAIGAVDRNDLPILPENATVIGVGIELDSAESVQATFDYDESTVNGEEIELWRHDGSEWSSVETFNATGGIETELTEDGVYAPVEVEEAPAEFAVSDLDPMTVTVDQCEPYDVSATVENVGGETGTQSVQLEIGAVVDQQQTVTLDGGESQTVTFANVDSGAPDPGNYQHAVSTEDDQVSGTITVQSDDPDPDEEGDPDSEEGDEEPERENGDGSDAEDETDGKDAGEAPDQGA